MLDDIMPLIIMFGLFGLFGALRHYDLKKRGLLNQKKAPKKTRTRISKIDLDKLDFGDEEYDEDIVAQVRAQYHVKDVNVLDEDGMAPLHRAVLIPDRRVALATIKALVDLGANINMDGNEHEFYTPLYYAAGRDDVGILKTLIKFGAKPNDEYAMRNAVKNGCIKNIQVLGMYGLNDDAWGAINTAIFENQADALQTLIDLGADIHGHGYLHTAATWGSCDVIRTLVSNGAEINELRGFMLPGDRVETLVTPLMYATIKGKIDSVRELLQLGASTDVKHVRNNTALHVATIHNYTDVVRVLIEYKADVNAQKANGDTPLHIAIRKQNKDAIKMLVNAGADVNIKNNQGMSCAEMLTILSQGK